MAATTASQVLGAGAAACSDVDDTRILRTVVRRDADTRGRAEVLARTALVRLRRAFAEVGTDAAVVEEAESPAARDDGICAGAE